MDRKGELHGGLVRPLDMQHRPGFYCRGVLLPLVRVCVLSPIVCMRTKAVAGERHRF